MRIELNKYQVATAIAVLFHVVGITGMLFFNRAFFVQLTPYNLLLSFGLLVWTQQQKNATFFSFMFIVFTVGFFAELTGVNTKLLFGDYSYGTVLGIKWKGTPLMIAINWFIIIYCCGISTHTLLLRAIKRVAADTETPPMMLRALSVILDGATLAVAFDWLMEPVAVKLGFWTWNGDGSIPFFNYVSWLLISILLLIAFQLLPFNKENKFAVNLLLVQAMFFLILRTFL